MARSIMVYIFNQRTRAHVKRVHLLFIIYVYIILYLQETFTPCSNILTFI